MKISFVIFLPNLEFLEFGNGMSSLGMIIAISPILKRTCQYRWWAQIQIEESILVIKTKIQEFKQQEHVNIKNLVLELSA